MWKKLHHQTRSQAILGSAIWLSTLGFNTKNLANSKGFFFSEKLLLLSNILAGNCQRDRWWTQLNSHSNFIWMKVRASFDELENWILEAETVHVFWIQAVIGLGSKPAETFGERRFEHDESEEATRPAAGYRLVLWAIWDCLRVNKIQWSANVLN